MTEKPKVGTIGWLDLTVPDATEIRDFYEAVVGWTHSEVPMKGYSDFAMSAPDGTTVGGVCHARGANAEIPRQWMVYIIVADLDASIAACDARGGKVVFGPRTMGEARYCAIQDPAGAVIALYQP
jgi:predicted enzyme related to lactoylglutathione lyase